MLSFFFLIEIISSFRTYGKHDFNEEACALVVRYRVPKRALKTGGLFLSKRSAILILSSVTQHGAPFGSKTRVHDHAIQYISAYRRFSFLRKSFPFPQKLLDSSHNTSRSLIHCPGTFRIYSWFLFVRKRTEYEIHVPLTVLLYRWFFSRFFCFWYFLYCVKTLSTFQIRALFLVF